MPDPHLRAADTDREAVAADLGTHMAAGRLTLAEYDERLARVYAARTYGELDELTADLPPLTPSPPQGDAAPTAGVPPAWPAPRAGGPLHGLPAPSPVPPWTEHGHAGNSWRAWLATSVIVLVVYLATSLGDGELDHFWPMWVIGPWGAVLLAQWLTGSRGDRGDRPSIDR